MAEPLDYVGTTLRQLRARGLLGSTAAATNELGNQKTTLAEQTLRWFDLFTEFFLDHHPDEQDDILYFVSDHPLYQKSQRDHHHQNKKLDTPPKVSLFVKRRPPSGTLPSLSFIVRWEETFYINLIAHLHGQVRLCVVEEESTGVTTLLRGRLYAQPMREGEPTFPVIYFGIAGEDLRVFLYARQTICVELTLHLIDFSSIANPINSDPRMATLVEDGDKVVVGGRYAPQIVSAFHIPLFQGAVSYTSLRAVHRNKVARWRPPGTSSRVLMKGPGGSGVAQVMVRERHSTTTTEGEAGNLLERFLTSSGTGLFNWKRGGPPLECSLSWISMDWQQVVKVLQAHFCKYW